MVKVEKTESNFFKGEYANENDITEVMFITEPIEVEKEFEGKTYMKVQGQIEYEGHKKGDPDILELNNTSKNTLIDSFGDDTKDWMGKKIPITSTIGGNKKWQILVDGTRLRKMKNETQGRLQ
jgi:hypothetical protein